MRAGSVINYAMDHMEDRWEQLRSIAALSSRLTFQVTLVAVLVTWW